MLLTNEELLAAFSDEIIGTIFGDEGFSKENAVRIRNLILLRMDIEND